MAASVYMRSGFHLKTSVVEFLFKKVAALKARNFIKKKLQHRCFPVNITKFLRTPFFAEHLWWLFLHCTGNCFVQCWPRQTKTKLRRLSSYRNIAVRSRANIAQVIFLCNVFFFYRGFLSQLFTNHRTAGGGGGHFLSPHYHFHRLHRHLDISRAITAESSHLHIGSSSRTRTGNLWFSSASR